MNQFDHIDKYLKYKSDIIGCSQNIYNLSILNENGIKNMIINAVKGGKSVSISTYSSIDYFVLDTNAPYHVNEGHIVKIIGLDDDKVIVDSWGTKYYLNISDLAENSKAFIHIRDVTIN